MITITITITTVVCMFVCKPDGNLYFCILYCMLNKTTVYDRYPLPRHKDLFNRFGLPCYFSSLDLRSGYWKVCIADSDINKTAFKMHYRLFKWWQVVLFGLTNAPGVFMYVMDWLFEDLLDQKVVSYDDILIYSTIA